MLPVSLSVLGLGEPGRQPLVTYLLHVCHVVVVVAVLNLLWVDVDGLLR